jgi:glucose-1-phosphatase
MTKIKFIYFDVGNVLNEFEGSFDETTNKFNIPQDKFFDFWMEHEDDLTRGKMNPDQFWKLAIKKFKLQNAESWDFADSWSNGYKPQSKTHELIKKLDGKHKIGLLTNHYLKMLEHSMKKGMVPDIKYDCVITSYDTGFRKPEIEIYKIATEKSGTLIEEILFIDDRPEFIEGAKKAGWQTVWFDMNNKEKSIKEIEKLLGV